MKNVKQRMIEDMKLRGLAPRTQDRYLHAIKALAEHYHRPPGQITEKQVRKYLLYLIETKGHAKSTFNIDLCAIKFLYRRTLGRDWSLLQIKGSKTNKRLPIVLSRDEMWNLLDLVRRPKPRMCLILMCTCGLRVSQAVNLRLDDIDGKRMVVWTRNTKGHRDRSVPLPIQTLTQLRLYRLQRRPKTWLFPSKYTTKAITTNCVQRCLKATLRQSNIHKNIGCHTLRHSYATYLMEAGVHLRVIQALLGHKRSTSTSSAIRCHPVIDERSRTYSYAVRPRWEAMYSNATTAVDSSIHITPVVTAVALNATRATPRHGSRREKRNSCR